MPQLLAKHYLREGGRWETVWHIWRGMSTTLVADQLYSSALWEGTTPRGQPLPWVTIHLHLQTHHCVSTGRASLAGMEVMPTGFLGMVLCTARSWTQCGFLQTQHVLWFCDRSWLLWSWQRTVVQTHGLYQSQKQHAVGILYNPLQQVCFYRHSLRPVAPCLGSLALFTQRDLAYSPLSLSVWLTNSVSHRLTHL